MASKTLYPFGVGGQTPSGIEIIDDLTTGGHDKAASAETVKELAQHVFMGSGSFGDAYDKARGNTVNFPWLLIDEDENGAPIKKMIWHAGNGEFIDAIGAEITGRKNGITINADAPGVISYTFGTFSTTAVLPFIDGEVNYSFNDVATLLKEANSGSGSTYDGKSLKITGITYDDATPSKLEIDFGWATVFWYGGGARPTIIKRMNISSAYGIFAGNSRLVEAQISGTITGWASNFLQNTTNLVEVDLSELKNTSTLSGLANFIGFSSGAGSNNVLSKVDIRNISTAGVADMSNMFAFALGLKTLIIGNFNTASATKYSGAFNDVSGATLVCTRDTPPTMHSTWNFITGHFTSIKVPNKTVEVSGEEVTVLSLYQSAAGWSTHASIMSTYEEGEY